MSSPSTNGIAFRRSNVFKEEAIKLWNSVNYVKKRRSLSPSRRRFEEILSVAEEVALVWEADGVGCSG